MKYKLKKEARQFFDENLHNEIKTKEFWEKQLISIALLDEVDRVYIDYGRRTSQNSANLCGWSSNNGIVPEAHFDFTVKVSDIDYKDYVKVKPSDLMDEMQKVLNRFFR